MGEGQCPQRTPYRERKTPWRADDLSKHTLESLQRKATLAFTPGLFTAQSGRDQKANILRLSLLGLFSKVPSRSLFICCDAHTHVAAGWGGAEQ